MGNLSFDITSNSSDFIKRTDEIRAAIQATAEESERQSELIEQSLNNAFIGVGGNLDKARLLLEQLKSDYGILNATTEDAADANFSLTDSFKKAFTALDGKVAIKQFVNDVIRVRGEFQQLEVTFKDLLQSKSAADELMSQIAKTAAETPFNLVELADGAKQLLSYDVQAEEVNETLTRLGSIALGTGTPLEQLTTLYGTVSKQSSIYATDIEQFATSGIPMIQGLADMFGVSTSKVNEMVSAGKIGFPDVQNVIENLTDEGSRFYTLMQEQSQTLVGKVDSLGGAWEQMLNEIGQSSEGAIGISVDSVKFLVEHYDAFGKVLLGLVGVYGTYRAALILNAVYEEGFHKAIWLKITDTKAYTAAQTACNKVLSMSPWMVATAAVVALGYGIYQLATYQTDAEKAQSKLNDAAKEYEKNAFSEQRELAKLKGELAGVAKGSDEYNSIKDKIVKNFGKYNEGLGDEIDKVGLTEEAYNSLTEAINKSFGARQYEKFAAEQQDELSNTMAENLEGIQERLLDELGDEYGSKIYAKIRNGVMQGTLSLGKGFYDFQGIDAETQAALDKAAGKDGGFFDIQNRAVEGYIRNIIIATNITDKLDKKARERFGVGENSSNDNKSSSDGGGEKNYDNVSSLAKKIREAEANLNALRSQAKKGLVDTDIVDKASSSLDNLKKKYASMTGAEYGVQSNQLDVNSIVEQQNKITTLQEKQKTDRQRQQQDLEAQLSQSKIDAMVKGFDKEHALRMLNNQKEIDNLLRQKKEYIQTVIQSEKEIFEAKEELNAKQKKGYVKQTFDPSSVSVDTTKFDSIIANTQKSQGNQVTQSLLDEYKSYTDQRLEIEEKYNNDIAILQGKRKQAETEGNTAQLEQITRSLAQATKKKGEELMGLDYDQLKKSPEYIRAFENLRYTSTETLNSLLSQLENAKQTAANVLSPDQLREYTTTIQEIMDELDSRNPFQALTDRKKELSEAEIGLADAKRNLDIVNSGGKVATGVKYNDKTGKMDTVYLSNAQALEKYNEAQNNVAEASEKVEKAEKEVGDVVGELSAAFKELGSAIGGQAGEIISLIGDVGTFAMTAMSGVTTASTTASAAVQAVEKASVILAIISAAIQIATKIASLFSGDDGIADYERAKEVYESYIDILDRIIEKQKELFELNSETGKQAYEQAKDTVKKQEDTSRQLGKQYLDAGASKGFLGVGSKSSHGVDQRKDISGTAWEQAKKALGQDFYSKGIGDGRMTGLFDLTTKQLEDLQRNAPLFWAELHSDTQKYLQQIIDCNDQLTQLENDRKEGLVKTDYSNFSDSFLNVLNDLDSSSKDFADNFEKYLQNAILTSLITDKYQADIKKLYDKWAADTDSDKKLTEKEAEDLRKQQEDLANAMLEERNQLMKDFGWTSDSSSSQEATQGGFETMSQETGSELNGRFSAMQVANEEMRISMQSLVINLASLHSSVADGNLTLTEMRNVAIMSNSYLQDIAGYTKRILVDFGSKLDNIERSAKIMAGS